MAKGPDIGLGPELSKFACHNGPIDEQVIQDVFDFVGTITPEESIPWTECFDMKDRSASVGAGWEEFYTNWGEMRDGIGDHALIQMCMRFEKSAFLSGDLCVPFKVHVKEDGYSQKKIDSKLYRTIQGGDVFFHLFYDTALLQNVEAALQDSRVHDVLSPK